MDFDQLQKALYRFEEMLHAYHDVTAERTSLDYSEQKVEAVLVVVDGFHEDVIDLYQAMC